MCTILLAHAVFEGRTVVASNRDEEYGRPFSPPRRRELSDGEVDWVVAPRDELEGGTWLGFNSRGILVTVSNLPYTSDSETRSRGLLCDDLLRTADLDEARETLKDSVSQDAYDGFNIVVTAPDGAFVAIHDGDLEFEVLDAGFHAVTNSRADDPDEKSMKALERIDTDESLDPWIRTAKDTLADHDNEVCVHGDDRGTTSSNLVDLLHREPEESRYYFADGKPCETEYERVF